MRTSLTIKGGHGSEGVWEQRCEGIVDEKATCGITRGHVTAKGKKQRLNTATVHSQTMGSPNLSLSVSLCLSVSLSLSLSLSLSQCG